MSSQVGSVEPIPDPPKGGLFVPVSSSQLPINPETGVQTDIFTYRILFRQEKAEGDCLQTIVTQQDWEEVVKYTRNNDNSYNIVERTREMQFHLQHIMTKCEKEEVPDEYARKSLYRQRYIQADHKWENTSS